MRHTHTHYCRSHRILDCDISDLRGDREREASENTVTGHAAHEPDSYAFAAEEAAESEDNRRSGHEIVARICQLLTDGAADAAGVGRNTLLLSHILGQSGCKTYCDLAHKLGVSRRQANHLAAEFCKKAFKRKVFSNPHSRPAAIVDVADGVQAGVSSETVAGIASEGDSPR